MRNTSLSGDGDRLLRFVHIRIGKTAKEYDTITNSIMRLGGQGGNHSMKRQLLIIMVLLITTFIGFAIIIPVFPEVVSQFHMNLMLAVYSLMSFIMSPIWGRLSDRFGRRPMIMIGTIGFSVSFLLLGLGLHSLWLMYLSRVLGGLFSGAVTSCAVAYVADITSKEDRTKGMGLVGMSIGLGFIFGPAVGGILAVYGNEVPFFASSALALITFFFVVAMLPESLPKEKRSDITARKTSRWVAFRGVLKNLYVLGFLVSFTLAALEGSLQYYNFDRFGATPQDLGYMFLISGIVGALVQGGVVRKYVRNGEESRFIQIGLVLSALGFFLLLFSVNFTTGAIYLSVFAAGNALIRPCVDSLITQKTTVGQGVATGLSSSMNSLGRITGPLMGLALFHFNHALPFVFGGLICLSALLLMARYRSKSHAV